VLSHTFLFIVLCCNTLTVTMMLYIYFPRPDRSVILTIFELSQTLKIVLVPARHRTPHSLKIVWNLKDKWH